MAATKSKSPFAALEALRDSLPKGPEQDSSGRSGPEEPPKPTRETAATQFDEKVVVARSKKGRGGKLVTTIQGVRAEAREPLAQEIRRAFGCGATVEDELIVVQGDQSARARGFLEARGARKVVISG